MISVQKTMVALVVALTLSLCGNAFMAGQLLTRHTVSSPAGTGGPLQPGPDQGRPGGGDALRGPMREFLRDLPSDVRAPFAASLRDNRETIGQQMRSVMMARRQAMEAMQAEPFDAEQLRAALAAQRAAQAGMQAFMHNQMIDVIAGLTPDQRAQLGGSLRKVFR